MYMLNKEFFCFEDSFCLNDPDAAFLGFANLSFKLSKSLLLYIDLALISIFLESLLILQFVEYLYSF